uniref:Phosphatase yidA n=1 Tax=Aegilops tauschii TaxID=37682 RepID=N1R2I3_AEGTA
MARIVSRALPFASRSHLHLSPPLRGAALLSSTSLLPHLPAAASTASLLSWRGFTPAPDTSRFAQPFAGFLSGIRGFRRARRGQAAAKREPPQDPAPPPPPKESEIELCARISVEDDLPDDVEVLNVIEIMKLNVPMAMKIALDGLLEYNYKTRDTSISDVGKYEKVEVSVLLCNDNFIQNLNKEWRGEDCATDMLSVSQFIPDLDVPTLMLGDIVISVETAARQAEARGHTLLDELRTLVVRGLLRLLGFDRHSDEAAMEMEKEELLILKSLRWKGRGLAKNAPDLSKPHTETLDGTLLNSKSQVTARNAEALKEARSRGVNIVIATGKTRPAAIDALNMVDLSGRNGIVSESSPGIFLQGLLVYGLEGREIYRNTLNQEVCREAFLYSLEHKVPLVAFSQDRCFSMFKDPLVDSLHEVYHEPKAEIVSSIDQLLGTAEIQKLVFIGTSEGVSSTLRPYWTKAIKERAGVLQAQPDMLELVPPATSKGTGVKILLDHLCISPDEVMAIGDGENDIEMLEVASLGVALANGAEKTKAVANVIGATNDEDGVAQAIYDYAF